MKVLRKMERKMGKENSIIKMEGTMMDSGKIIKCMAGEDYIMLEEN